LRCSRVLARNTGSRHVLGDIFYGQVRSDALKIRIGVKIAGKRKHKGKREKRGEKEVQRYYNSPPLRRFNVLVE